MRSRRLPTLLIAICLTACKESPTEPRTTTTLAAGRWAGSGVCLSVTDTTCDLVAGCGHGQFPKPAIRSDGTFDVDGTFRIEVGPVVFNPPPPAHFSGSVTGSTLTIKVVPSTVTPPDATYSLQRGAPGICGVPCV